MKQSFHSLIRLMAAVAVVCSGNVSGRAAQVGPAGYTNAFGVQPPVGDWSTFSIAGGGGDISVAAGLDSAVLAVAASSVNGATVANGTTPPDANVNATWASAGLHLQTRPANLRYAPANAPKASQPQDATL